MGKRRAFSLGSAVLLLFALSGCSSSSDDAADIPPGDLFAEFGTDGVLQSNPTSDSNDPRAAVAVGAYLYLVGTDRSGSNYQWRVEKRNLGDGALVSGFGSGGIVTSDPSTASDQPYAAVTDGTYLYIVGFDNVVSGDARWRIEKRSLSDGSLVTSFDTDGVVTSNPSAGYDTAKCVSISGSYLYVAGDDYTGDIQWRIEKRRLDTGALDTTFGAGTGIITSDQYVGLEFVTAMAVDASALYVAGMDPTGGYRGRIEKRDLSTGVLVDAFGSSGIKDCDWSLDDDAVNCLAVDSSGLYVIGYDESAGADDAGWRIVKLALSTGGVLWERSTNPSSHSDTPAAAFLDGEYLYVAGSDYVPGSGDSRWRLEKRSANDGTLVLDFGTSGLVSVDPSSFLDGVKALAISGTSLYAFGSDFSVAESDEQWRVERRRK